MHRYLWISFISSRQNPSSGITVSKGYDQLQSLCYILSQYPQERVYLFIFQPSVVDSTPFPEPYQYCQFNR